MNSPPPFETIVAQHGDRVLRLCRAVAGPDDADDAWSETFLAALQAYPALPADANHVAWLVTIAHRKAIDLIRSRARRAVPVAELPLGPPGRPDEPAPAGEQDTDLVEAMAKLSAKQRQCVAYHYVAGLSYAEVAQVVGGSADAARRAAADGIRALRTSYPHPDQEGSR